jgi:hypothetical protein
MGIYVDLLKSSKHMRELKYSLTMFSVNCLLECNLEQRDDNSSSENHLKNRKTSRGSYLDKELYIFCQNMLILPLCPVPLSIGTDDKDIKTGKLSFYNCKRSLNLNGISDGVYKNTLHVLDKIEN